MQVQLQGSSVGTIADDSNVLFDTFINATSSNITYDNVTGIFTINKAGNYYVSWWVNTDGAGTENNVTFGIRVISGSIQGPIISSSPVPIVTLQLSGNALLTVGTVPTEFSLFNNSGATVNYGITPVQANLLIL